MLFKRGMAVLLTAVILSTAAWAATVTEVVPCAYDHEVLFQEGDYILTVRDGMGVVCRSDGTPVLESDGDQILLNGYILVQGEAGDSVWGTDGTRRTEDYGEIVDVQRDIAICGKGTWHPPGRLEGVYGAVDLLTGEMIVPPAYQGLGFSADGTLLVGRNGDTYRVFDLTGADVTAESRAVPVQYLGNGFYGIVDAVTGKYGVADENGKIAVPPLYWKLGSRILSGVCLVADESGKWGVSTIDGSGDLIQPIVYQDALAYAGDVYALSRWGWIRENGTVELHYGDGAVAIPSGTFSAVEAVCGDVVFAKKPGSDVLYCVTKTGQPLCSFPGGYVALSDESCDYVLLGKDGDVAEIAVVNRWGEILSPYTRGDSLMSSGGSIGKGLELFNSVTERSRFLMADGRGVADPDGGLMADLGVVFHRDEAGGTDYLTDLDGNTVIPAGVYREIGTDRRGYTSKRFTIWPDGLYVRDMEGKYGLIRVDCVYDYAPHPWARAEIDAALEAGILPADQIRDWRDGCTRGDFCRLVMAALESVSEDLTGTAAVTFIDTDDPEILRAAALGIVGGVGGGKFAPNRPVTRQEAAVMLARAGAVLKLEATGEQKTFADAGDFAPWAADGVDYTTRLMGGGTPVMGGVSADRFAPLGTYTREQAALTMLRLVRSAG